MKMPYFIRPLFHNYDSDSIDLNRHWRLVIKTVMTAGSWEQIKWMSMYYGEEKLKQVISVDLEGLQELPRVVSNFWSIVLWGERLPPQTKSERWLPRRSIPTKVE